MDYRNLHQEPLGEYSLTRVILKGRYHKEIPPKFVYHYTSPEGLKGILTDSSFYFTDCQYLNDAKERININEDLDCFWGSYSRNYDPQFCELLNDIGVNEFEDAEYAYSESDRSDGFPKAISRYFVFSTSKAQDSLNMWKYYAKNSTYNGYCVGLSIASLDNEWGIGDQNIAFEQGEVIYDNIEKMEIIRRAVDILYENWCRHEISRSFNEKIRKEFQSWLSITSLFFKHASFHGEEEYRYVAISPVFRLNDLNCCRNGTRTKMYDFRLVDGVFTPYIKIPFWGVYSHHNDAIVNVTISPSANSAQKKLGLSTFVRALHYPLTENKIEYSSVPLRY